MTVDPKDRIAELERALVGVQKAARFAQLAAGGVKMVTDHLKVIDTMASVALAGCGTYEAEIQPAHALSVAREGLRKMGCTHDDAGIILCDDPPLCDTQSVACSVCGAVYGLPTRELADALRKVMRPPAW